MDRETLLLEQWKMAAELHQNEDRLMWQRFSYFVTVTGILISGLGIVLTANTQNDDRQYLLLVVISLFGFVVSLAFSSVFRRAFYYHTHRINQAKEAEKALCALVTGCDNGMTIYGKGVDSETLEIREWAWILARYRTGNVIFALTLLIAASWVVAGGYGLYLLFGWAILVAVLVVLIVLLIAVKLVL